MTFNYCYPVGEEVMDDWADGGGNGWILVPDIDLQRLNWRVLQIEVCGEFGIGFVSCELSLEERVKGSSSPNQKVIHVKIAMI